ncbi:MAG: hypothetical protein HYV36_03375 [Lentisphaerae bacterium]|nr:hypothetical protein [Lentisphaerota bacterium]
MDKQTVRGIIDQLLIVQERDCHMARCQQELSEIPNRKQSAEGKLTDQRSALEKAQATHKTCLAAIKNAEVEIETIRQQVAKLREQQFQIKSNEEFKVLNKEIGALQEKVRSLEDREIELMESAELSQREADSWKAKVGGAEETMRGECRQLDERRKNLEAEMQQLAHDRQGLASGIPADWLTHYTRVMENRRDAALVSIEGKRLNACGGCHMTLPPHILQDVKHSETLITCSFCARLLYWPG